MPPILQALGLSTQQDSARLTLRRGSETRVVNLPATQVNPPWPPDTDIALTTPKGWADACRGPGPLYLQAPLEAHRLIDLPESKALYAQLNWVADTDAESLDRYGKRILERARQTNPRAIILDLRLDQGGNGNLANSLVSSLIRAEDADTHLFVITGRGTFSASQFILNDLDRLTDAVFAGEPASSKPSSYGDAFKTNLPNSGIAMRTSIYWWQDGQDFDPYTWIDVAAPLRFADYASCRDPALEAVLSYSTPKPLDDILFEAARLGGIAGARQAVKGYLTETRNRYQNVRVALPRAAEMVFHAGHKAEAVIAANAVAEALPDTVDAWVVLAYVALQNGEKSLAKTAAQRAIGLDPNQRTARELLEQASAP
jgi:tetratricopeptide (TPR) repeat protein